MAEVPKDECEELEEHDGRPVDPPVMTADPAKKKATQNADGKRQDDVSSESLTHCPSAKGIPHNTEDTDRRTAVT